MQHTTLIRRLMGYETGNDPDLPQNFAPAKHLCHVIPTFLYSCHLQCLPQVCPAYDRNRLLSRANFPQLDFRGDCFCAGIRVGHCVSQWQSAFGFNPFLAKRHASGMVDANSPRLGLFLHARLSDPKHAVQQLEVALEAVAHPFRSVRPRSDLG